MGDAVVVPVNSRWTAAEVGAVLRDCGATVLVVDDSYASMLADLRRQAPNLSAVVAMGDAANPQETVDHEDLIADAARIEDSRRGGDALFGIFYTGGTTGPSKGAMLTHDNVLTSALGSLATGEFVTPGGSLLHVAPLFHLADLAMWVAMLVTGGTHVMLPQFTPAGVLAAIEEHRITDMLLVPTMIQLLVDCPDTDRFDVTNLNQLVYRGSSIAPAVLARARKALPAARLVQAYGMTELAPVATLLLPADHDVPELVRSAGRAAPHSAVRIVDADGAELRRGEVGEIVVGGDHVMLGYWQRPDETTHALRDGWMHTGDAGFMDGKGYVYVVDRIKDVIITGDENVYPAEVDGVLAGHPAVVGCAVIGLPDQKWGERVHAVVVLAPGASVTADDLRPFCRRELAGYKVPRSVEFVDALPISAAGKVLKRQLRSERLSGVS
ncbi:AMP-binding protein [Micromonospora sp. NPDC051006]|uniref:AMP-binding protein n=1 Tax=Micromonospora sp. NPDC051006 TaxID=3364283 RepID=UPI0037A4D426